MADSVIPICLDPNRVFTINEADDMIPLISRITGKHEKAVQDLLDKQRYFIKTGAPEDLVKRADTQVGKHLVNWGSKLTKLGIKVFGYGFVGFNSGFGYWSYRQGDGDKISFYHDYNETPLQRRKLSRLPHGPQIG